MKREEVEDFLNFPGIVGIALMDGRSRPYFYGVDQALNFQQKEALAQGIQQVVETTPPGFEFFEFQFTGHHAYIYKLDRGLILLVLTHTSLIYADYAQAIERLRSELKADAANAIATFRLLAGNISLSNQNYWKQTTLSGSSRSDTSVKAPLSVHSPPIPEQISSGHATHTPLSTTEASQPAPFTAPSVLPAPAHAEDDPSLAPASSSPDDPLPPTYKELLAAANQISHLTVRYLGPTVVSNYWKATRPSQGWLAAFQVERSAQITLSAALVPQTTATLTPEELHWFRQWISAFMERCSKIIRDFPTLLEQSALDDRQKALLFIDKT